MLGLTMGLIEMIVLAFAKTSLILYVSLVAGALGGLAGPTIQGLISRQVSESEQGKVQGALTAVNSLVGVVGPLLATWVYAYFNGGGASIKLPGAAFLMAAVFSALGLVLAWLALRKIPSEVTRPRSRQR